MEHINYQKCVPVESEYDVLVTGAGPSGICAAVAAARTGARTAIIERYGAVGGNLTVGSVGPIMGNVGRGTMRDELTGLLSVGFNDMQGITGRLHDTENAKGILIEFLHKEGVEVYLQTPVVDTIVENNCVMGVIAGKKEGLRAILADIVVDATGDGDTAYFAGAAYEIGREGDGLTQPVTLMYTLAGVDEATAITCQGEEDNVTLRGERFLDFTARCCKQGILPENTQSVRLYKSNVPGERHVNTTQANGVLPTDSRAVMQAELVLRKQIEQVTDFLRRYVPGYQNCYIKTTASTLGVRESRRFTGEYVLNDNDLRNGRRFNDVVVHDANCVIDIHNPTGGGQAEGLPEVVKPYDIPYRCLIPEKIDNLILSGRCISGTHRAHASYRIMSICMAIGEAAGVAAALSSRLGVNPRKLDYKKVQQVLIEKGIVLFD